MITIKTEKHTYTAKMGAEESEKLFRELVMQLFGYTGQLSIPETEAAVIPEIPACVSKNEKETEEKPDAMKELENTLRTSIPWILSQKQSRSRKKMMVIAASCTLNASTVERKERFAASIK